MNATFVPSAEIEGSPPFAALVVAPVARLIRVVLEGEMARMLSGWERLR